VSNRVVVTGRPCCYRRFVVVAHAGRPSERYSRVCRPCGIRWQLRRETISVGLIVRDSIVWLNTTSRAQFSQ
jgi:hypothetical protein